MFNIDISVLLDLESRIESKFSISGHRVGETTGTHKQTFLIENGGVISVFFGSVSTTNFSSQSRQMNVCIDVGLSVCAFHHCDRWMFVQMSNPFSFRRKKN